MKWGNQLLGAFVAVLMTACGGGGGGSTPGFGTLNGNTAFGNNAGNTTTTTTTAPDVSTNSGGTVVLSLSSSTASASQPVTVTAVVKDAAGIPIPGALVQFSLSGTVTTGFATMAPSSALTDANGQAATTLTPAVGSTSGAAYVNASADTTAGTLTAKKAFSVTALNVALTGISASSPNISGYGNASINIYVAGASSATPVTVTLSSTCASNGKASISPSSLTITGNSGLVTYQDKGCGTGGAADRISAQITGTTEQRWVEVTAAAPTAKGIQFVSADRASICLKGTGCPSVANVTFKVVDQTGAPQASLPVDFTLDNVPADLGSAFGVTGADGTVSVAVAARNTPSPVRVLAQVRGTGLQTVSNVLTISGGLPVASMDEAHSGISFAADKYALNYGLDGDTASLTLRLTDRYGAPAVDGTVVNLVSDGGTVVPAYCVTKDGTGACSAKLIVSNPRPASGRVHVVAYANGQEYFTDINGDGVYSGPAEFATGDDVPAAVCLDKNENLSCDVNQGEFLVGDVNQPDHLNNTWDDGGVVFARTNVLFFFSFRNEPRLYQASSSGVCSSTPVDDIYFTFHMLGRAQVTKYFCLRDGNTAADGYSNLRMGVALSGNPVPSGTQISAAPSMTNASVSFGGTPVTPVPGGPTFHSVTVSNTSTASPQPALVSGTATITFIMPTTGSVPSSQLIYIQPN